MPGVRLSVRRIFPRQVIIFQEAERPTGHPGFCFCCTLPTGACAPARIQSHADARLAMQQQLNLLLPHIFSLVSARFAWRLGFHDLGATVLSKISRARVGISRLLNSTRARWFNNLFRSQQVFLGLAEVWIVHCCLFKIQRDTLTTAGTLFVSN